MSKGKILAIDYSQKNANATFVPSPRIHSSEKAGWKNIHLAHYQLPAIEIPETMSLQHLISVPAWQQPTEVEIFVDGKRHLLNHVPNEIGYIEMIPAYTPLKVQASQAAETTHCYLDPAFLTHVAQEFVDPETVELKPMLSVSDPLVFQIILALKTVLETDATNSCFYAESMATALAIHFLRNYSMRQHSLPKCKNGLPKYKLHQALEFIEIHLSENISLTRISDELEMSQYHFCRLFKQSTGMTPHAYLIQQRVERSKQLLKQRELTITQIAIECGFANPSHFAKHFQKHTGISPKQFRIL